MDQLLDGYRRFRYEVWPEERARYERLAKFGQSPETLVVACCDSRVDPQTVFGAVAGELFVVRNIAGVVPPYQPDQHYHGTSAALEFGVRVIKVKRVVVLGHAQCGGVAALVDGVPPEAQDFVSVWMELLEPARARVAAHDAHHHDEFEKEVVKLSLENLRTFPWIAERVAAGTLELAGFRFDIHTGVLMRLVDGGFEAVT
jgi:carbonic anhydrase